MIAKDKAEKLFDKYFLLHESSTDENGFWVIAALNKGLAKKCALIAVDECLNTCVESMVYYWEEVKHEIENL